MRPSLALALLINLAAAPGCTPTKCGVKDGSGAASTETGSVRRSASASSSPWAETSRPAAAAAQTASVPTPPAPSTAAKPSAAALEKPAPQIPRAAVDARLVPSPGGGAEPSEYGCDEKSFRWLRGRIARIHIGRERFWQLRYAPLDHQDNYGGRFILEGYISDDFHDGDLVYVEGRILTEPKDAKAGRYRCHHMSMVKPGDDSVVK